MPKRKAAKATTTPPAPPKPPKGFSVDASEIIRDIFRKHYTPGQGDGVQYVNGQYYAPLFGDRTLEPLFETIAEEMGEKMDEQTQKVTDLESDLSTTDDKVTQLEADIARLTEELEAEKRCTDAIKENYQRLEEWEKKILAARKRVTKRNTPIRDR